MAVVINGSGTVTGLAVGGLPDGTVDAGTLATDSVTAAKIPDTVEADLKSGRKNLIINGGMKVAQRGDYTTATAISSGSYYLDRYIAHASNITGTIQQTDVTIGGVNKKAQKIVATSSGTGYIGVRQKIELQNIPVGETVTASCWVRANNANTRFRAGNFAGTSTDGAAFTNDGNWEKVTWSFDSTGTVTDPELWVITYDGDTVSVSSGDYIEYTELQLEVGSSATDFEYRSYGEELALCQRYYYQDIRGIAQEVGVAWYYTSNHVSWIVNFPVPMRAQPTMDYSGPTNGWTIYRNGAADTLTSMVMENVNLQNNRASMYNSTQVSGTAGQTGILRATHSNCLLSFSAEL